MLDPLPPEEPTPEEEILADIFSLRRDIASARQYRHNDSWSKLESLIEELRAPLPPYRHPYRLSDDHYGALSKNEVFRSGRKGFCAELPDEGYLFRLSSVGSLIDYAGLRDKGTPEETFRWLREEYRVRDDWLPLGEYSEGGELMERLGFTWWTSLTLSPEEVVIGAQRLGLVLSGHFKVLLRCPAARVKAAGLAHVPTVIDAFANDIFHPTDDHDQPKHGVTISLERLQSLEEGADEFVVGGVDVGLVELWPIQVTEDMRRACPLWPDELRRCTLLQEYYRRMLAPRAGGQEV